MRDCFKSFEGEHYPISFTIQKTEKAEKNYQTAGESENQFKTQTSGSKEAVEGFCFTSLAPSVKSTDTTRVVYQRNSGGWFGRQNESYINEPGLSSYEKIKKYNALLQRYLTFTKQGQKDEWRVTLTLQREQTGDRTGDQTDDQTADRVGVRVSDETDFDNTADEVLKNLPPRDRKNAEYIIKKLSKSDGGWNPKGEFVYRGEVVKGSHMIDLFKHLS